MRLLVIQDQLRIGGTERQTLFLCRFFIEQAIDCHLLIFRPGGHLATEENLHSIPHTFLQKTDSKVSLYAPNLYRKIKHINPDAVLCMGRTANCYSGHIQKKFPEVHVIGTLRTGKTLFPLQRIALPQVKSLIVNSNWWERQLVKHDIPPERIHVAHNSLLLNRCEEERLYLRNKYRTLHKIDPETPIFLNVSTFRKGKRHIDLLKAFKQVREEYPDDKWQLWLVGDGKEYKNCQRWAAHNGLGTRVRFFHFQKDPFPFYAAADVAISASREDSLPNFLIEAQATSLPFIAFECRGVAECCLPQITGKIIPAANINLLAQAIHQWIHSPEERHQYAQPAAEFARRKFAQIPQAQATLDFIRSRILKHS